MLFHPVTQVRDISYGVNKTLKRNTKALDESLRTIDRTTGIAMQHKNTTRHYTTTKHNATKHNTVVYLDTQQLDIWLDE